LSLSKTIDRVTGFEMFAASEDPDPLKNWTQSNEHFWRKIFINVIFLLEELVEEIVQSQRGYAADSGQWVSTCPFENAN
jgi:hypothetical protein